MNTEQLSSQDIDKYAYMEWENIVIIGSDGKEPAYLQATDI